MDVQVEFDPFGRGSDTWGGEGRRGGPQGHPGGDLGLVERPGHAEPPPKKTAQFLAGAKKQIGSHFGFSSAWKK